MPVSLLCRLKVLAEEERSHQKAKVEEADHWLKALEVEAAVGGRLMMVEEGEAEEERQKPLERLGLVEERLDGGVGQVSLKHCVPVEVAAVGEAQKREQLKFALVEVEAEERMLQVQHGPEMSRETFVVMLIELLLWVGEVVGLRLPSRCGTEGGPQILAYSQFHPLLPSLAVSEEVVVPGWRRLT